MPDPTPTLKTATAIACSNIAFIKYWGNRDHRLRLPSNGSLSMNLGGLHTRTTVTFDPTLPADHLTLNGQPQRGAALARVAAFLDIVRQMATHTQFARVESANNFPTGTGIASSAAAFAALALAASTAAGLQLNEPALSALARRGSGSASRSVPAGFVEWQPGKAHNSHAVSIAPPGHWALVDLIAIVSQEHKSTGSTQGHALADSSPLQAARVADTPRRLSQCRAALLQRDFAALADIIEHDALMMHAVMMTSQPALIYWQPATLGIMHAVQSWRAAGQPLAFTIDAGPNVHVICEAGSAPDIATRLGELPGVLQVLSATPGGAVQLVG